MKIKVIVLQDRCDVCRQSDMFDPETGFCSRCQNIALTNAAKEPAVAAAPLPDFLVRKLGINVAIRCAKCGEFIMSRSSACRHCGSYNAFEEAAPATQYERRLCGAFEWLNQSKAAANLCWEFLRLHLWGFPLTLLLAPLSAIGSLILFMRTLWLSAVALIKFGANEKADPRVSEARRAAISAAAKSAAALALAASIGAVVIYSGVLSFPLFWDNYSKARSHYDKRNYKEAENLFKAAVEAHPDNVDARIYLARSIWNQYVRDPYADKERNENSALRASEQFRIALNQTRDLKKQDDLYVSLGEIYRTVGAVSEFEECMLARASLLDQTDQNRIDSYIKLGAVFAGELSNIVEKHQIKGSYPKAWIQASKWRSEDLEKAKASTAKAEGYLNRALEIAPKHEVALPVLEQLQKDLLKAAIVAH